MSRTPLFDALKEYNRRSRGYFRIPGHRFQRGIPKEFRDFAGDNIFKIDITETPLTDDLHNPRTVIAESQGYTAEAFGAERSFYLVNGTTCGNQSMIIAAASEGEKILVPRNAHKSVMAGLIISGAVPVYMPVDYIREIGITGALKPETARVAALANPDARGIFAVSPNYHGLCSDLGSLAETAHENGMPLLVDEAHGAHYYFCDSLPDGALSLGADAAAQSLHKVAGALTQSSLLHLKSELIDAAKIDSALRMTMSTSPSYILMTSLELARDELEKNGSQLWEQTISLAERMKSEINRAGCFHCPGKDELETYGVHDSDPTRIIINCDNAGISGYDLKTRLWKMYSIDVEMADSRNILLLLTPGNTAVEADNLISALQTFSPAPITTEKPEAGELIPEILGIPQMALPPRKAYFSKTKIIPWSEITGKVAAEPAAPYPPGIPVLYPGEIITKEIFEFLNSVKAAGRHMHGPGDHSLSTFRICDI
ncbi:MAG: aminotransferase class I/II-fold pyridoxal phosphate-dependent enzyme [Spirochaetales bacterium]|nr:aminotransferase class I/II-fold pyridoxal phosphate-dependent enzyme [Spirochaetales bacterium]